MMRCARCQKPLTVAYVQDGPFAWGPKCARIQGFTTPTGPRIKAPEPQSKDDAQMSLDMEPIEITQGHKYAHKGVHVLAIHAGIGGSWFVRPIAGEWLGSGQYAQAEDLHPMPMKYFHGQIPA